MSKLRVLFSNANVYVVGSIGLATAVTVSWIVFKIINPSCLKKRYSKLSGKVVVITGASSGIGEALAHEFYKNGSQVVLCARQRPELERVQTDLLQTECQVATLPPIVVPLDLKHTTKLQTPVEEILSLTGRIDILVNNGSIAHGGRVQDTVLDVDKKIMVVNYFGPVALTKAVLPGMLENKQGQIVFISSVLGLIGLPGRSAYCASKHALHVFADCLRAEVALENISVSVISLGYVKNQANFRTLTGAGTVRDKIDSSTAARYTAEHCAEEILEAITREKKELVMTTPMVNIAIAVRKFFPSLYFFVMDQISRPEEIN